MKEDDDYAEEQQLDDMIDAQIEERRMKPHFEIVIDMGKPYTENAETMEEVKAILTKLYAEHIKDKDDFPHVDINIYDNERGVEITDELNEMFDEIIGE